MSKKIELDYGVVKELFNHIKYVLNEENIKSNSNNDDKLIGDEHNVSK